MELISANPINKRINTKSASKPSQKFQIGKQFKRILKLSAGLFVWSLLLGASFYNDMLFFNERLVSSFIIGWVVFLRIMESKTKVRVDNRNKN